MTKLSYTELLEAWDRQQSAYIANREERFNIIIELLSIKYEDNFTVFDIGCGPGSFTSRLLRAFPKAKVISIDIDPLLLAVAKGALADNYGERLKIVQADLAQDHWLTELGDITPQAVVSSTALHWLLPQEQLVLYKNVYQKLTEDGIFLNADHQHFDDRFPIQKSYAEQHDRITQQKAWDNDTMNWNQWFSHAMLIDDIAALNEQHEAIFSQRPTPFPTPVDFHLAILRQAGFKEVGTIWQFLDDYIVAGWK